MTIQTLKWLDTYGRFVHKREFRVPWGICDIVGVEFSPERSHARVKCNQTQRIGPPFRIALLQLIPAASTETSITSDALGELIASPVQTVEDQLQQLVKRRFVVRQGDGSYQSLTPWAPLHTRIVAVELKLGRIDEVIAQAISHRAFATESFIGLPEDKAQRILDSRRAVELKQAGVDLLAVNHNEAGLLISPPPNKSADPVLQMHCVERLWSPPVLKGRPP